MDLVNLAHGSLYMLGAYFAATFAAWTGSFVLGAILALGATLLVGMAVEVIAMRRLYGRDHLDHVLATFGLILFFDELVRLIWGAGGMSLPLPSWLNTSVRVLPGVDYSAYKLSIIVVSLAVAAFLYFLVMRTRLGMLIRAGASNREMVGALGVNIKLLFTLVFGLGAALAGLAGLMQAPILTVQIGMGENILILAFVITVDAIASATCQVCASAVLGRHQNGSIRTSRPARASSSPSQIDARRSASVPGPRRLKPTSPETVSVSRMPLDDRSGRAHRVQPTP